MNDKFWKKYDKFVKTIPTTFAKKPYNKVLIGLFVVIMIIIIALSL